MTDHALKTVSSLYSVATTVDRLEAFAKEKGMKIFARVDHAGEAKAVGLEMRPTEVLIFGSPLAGTPIMVARPMAAIDLPVKALAWEDASGEVWLTYNTSDLLRDRHGVSEALAARVSPVGVLIEHAAK